MQHLWFVLGVSFFFLSLALRVAASLGVVSGRAGTFGPFVLVAALVCLAAANRFRIPYPSLRQAYGRRTQVALAVGLICLLVIPFLLWLIYSRYYGPLFEALSAGE